MNAQELLDAVSGMLGFRVQERDNDAVLIRGEGTPQIRVRPATGAEVVMFTKLLGLSARIGELTEQDALTTRQNQALLDQRQKMGEALQAADLRIKDLHTANRAWAEEHAFLKETFETYKTEMHERWTERLRKQQESSEEAYAAMEKALRAEIGEANAKAEHMEEARDSAQEAASQMHSHLSDAEGQIIELKAEIANLQQELSKYDMVEGHG